MENNEFDLLALIEDNNRGEREAISGYYNLLADAKRAYAGGEISEDYYKKINDVIEEIISDELNHSEKLAALVFEGSEIKSATD